MVGRLLDAGHEVVVRDPQPPAVAAAVAKGAVAADSAAAMVKQLGDGAVVWLMIPAQLVDAQVDELLGVMAAGDSIIDGGNSDYRLTLARAKRAEAKGVRLVDVGTSGGVLTADAGYCMMVGGPDEAVKPLEPLFGALAQPQGWQHFGPTGSGHYIKMVHNAVEYGAMQALAEGYQLLHDGQFPGLDLAAIAAVWQHGSINESLLNELVAKGLAKNPTLDGIEGKVAESGEAGWALEAAQEAGLKLPATQAAIEVRRASRQGEVSYATKLLAVIRNEFGGHALNIDKK
jgi:6-phosphogluconate dehydrogenase